ncbi:AI-2E family transporter [Nitrosococcus wardiae]|uniref:AI-2E family transporter n=1 Tax=Nitrosococcus wardiae TaxID=1814290 RepID=UPI003B83A496
MGHFWINSLALSTGHSIFPANVLVPFLFAEVVDLHPVAVIVAIVVFGGIWGFLGAFFAIPLATLIQAVLKTWPKLPPVEEQRPLLKHWGNRFLPGRQRSRLGRVW